MTALLEIGADVGWPDSEAIGAARNRADARHGRLAELIEWLAGAQGRFPPIAPNRPRLVVLDAATDSAADLAAAAGVGVRALELNVPDAFSAGADAVDGEIEAGADLIVLAAAGDGPAATVLVSLLAGAEPVTLLPRGAHAVDTGAWTRQAEALRDVRRNVVTLRSRPDELLRALDSAAVAMATGVALRAAARRTPVILDGLAAVAAAMLCVDIQARARHWWQIADTSRDRAHRRATEHLEMVPILDLGTDLGDGTAGVLALQVLRTAAATGARDG